jgi:hypothetical protein
MTFLEMLIQELLCCQRVCVYEFIVCAIAGCLFDYCGCCLILPLLEGSLPLDSDPRNTRLPRRSWITSRIRCYHVHSYTTATDDQWKELWLCRRSERRFVCHIGIMLLRSIKCIGRIPRQ